MRQLEIIHLRSFGEPLDSLGDKIGESIKTVDMNTEVAMLYRRGLETDVAIHISTLTESGAEGPSSLGVRLASALRSFGIVEHTLWEELK